MDGWTDCCFRRCCRVYLFAILQRPTDHRDRPIEPPYFPPSGFLSSVETAEGDYATDGAS